MNNTASLVQNEQFLNQSMYKSLPFAMITTLGATVNVFLDGILVGQKLGANGFTAVNLCMPIYLLICTLGSLIGSGGAIMSSHAIGGGDFKRGGRIYSVASGMILVVSLLFTAVGLLFIDDISALLTGNGALYNDVRSYASVTIAGSLPSMYMYITLHYLRLDGKHFFATVSAVVMSVVNIILDIVFLFVFDMGIGGAAAAGVAGSLCACVISMTALAGSRNFKLSAGIGDLKEALGILKCGSPAALNNLMSALRILCVNSVLLNAFGDFYVSMFSVLNNLAEFSLFFVNGIPTAAAPIIGVYSSEKSNDGLRILVKYQIKVHLVVSVIFSAAVILFANQLSGMFGVEAEMRYPVVCLAASVVLGGINSIMICFYGNSRKTHIANILTVSRIFVLSVASLMALIAAKSFIWLFLPVTELLTIALLAGVLCIIHCRKKQLSPILLLDYRWQQDGNVLDFSVDATPEAICEASEKISDFCGMNNLTPKQTMRLELAIEEILTLMTDKCLGTAQNKTFDLRAFHMDGSTGIRIRCLGRMFNPFAENNDMSDEQELSAVLIKGIAKDIEYQHILGANSIVLVI